jgi:hypothetical protein
MFRVVIHVGPHTHHEEARRADLVETEGTGKMNALPKQTSMLIGTLVQIEISPLEGRRRLYAAISLYGFSDSVSIDHAFEAFFEDKPAYWTTADYHSQRAIGLMDALTHSADPNANHEWQQVEVKVALERAPRWILTPLVLARYQGFRGQTCKALTWRNYIDDPKTGKAFDLTLRKNAEMAWFPCEPETRKHLDGLDKTSTFICTTSEGKPWKNEQSMQGSVSDFLTGLKTEGLIREGCTLHGLRVTYAASIRRMDLDAGTVADALGDRSTRMGEHYTRHVEKEAGRMRAWTRKNGPSE